jgi:hypothetical protein
VIDLGPCWPAEAEVAEQLPYGGPATLDLLSQASNLGRSSCVTPQPAAAAPLSPGSSESSPGKALEDRIASALNPRRRTCRRGHPHGLRGADTVRAGPVLVAGTIPAGAGSSRSVRPRLPAWRDHPRGCGEQRWVSISASKGTGPSPRVRGADFQVVAFGDALGTIPAGAGSRDAQELVPRARGDHPRGCGEQQQGDLLLSPGTGPSPRVRGAVQHVVVTGPVMGTIPAGAGSRPGCP